MLREVRSFARRVRVEAHREWGRPSTFHMLVAATGGVVALAVACSFSAEIELYLRIVFLFSGLGLALVGGVAVTRDHRRGFSDVLVATPLGRFEALLAKIVFLGGLYAAFAALALLPTFALLARFVKGYDGILGLPLLWPPATALRVLQYVAMGFVVALFSSAAGILVASASARVSRGPTWRRWLIGAFWVVWFAAGVLAALLAMRPGRDTVPTQAVLEATPIGFALGALDATPATRLVDDVAQLPFEAPVRWLVVAAAVALVVAGFFAVLAPAGRHSNVARALGVFAVLVLVSGSGVKLLQAVEHVPAGGGLPVDRLPGVTVRAQVRLDPSDPLHATERGAVTAVVELTGSGRWTVSNVRLRAPGVDFSPNASSATLDLGRDGTQATAFNFTVDAINHLDGALSRIDVDADVARVGEAPLDVSLTNPVAFRDPALASSGPALRVGLIALAGLAALAAAALTRSGFQAGARWRMRAWTEGP